MITIIIVIYFHLKIGMHTEPNFKKLYKIQFQFLTKFNLRNSIRPEMFALDSTEFNIIPLNNLRRNEMSRYI
jgi:hypothetical protein